MSETPYKGLPPAQGLYNPANERDACGIGFVVNIKAKNRTTSCARGFRFSSI